MGLVPLFFSCKDDDKEPEPDSGDNGGGSSPSSAVINFNGEVLTSLRDDYEYNYIDYDGQGRVERIETEDEYFEINYSKGTFILNGDKGTVKFNSRGLITDLFISYEGTEDGERYVGKDEMSYSYDSYGQLTKMTGSYEEIWTSLSSNESYEEKGLGTCILNWKNNNLISAMIESEYYEDGERDTRSERHNIKYGSQKNEFRQMPYVVSDYAIFDNEIQNTLASVGLFGVGPVNLPVSFDQIVDEDRYDYTMDLSFSLNKNGSISEESYNYSTYYYGYSYFRSRSSAFSSLTEKKTGYQRLTNGLFKVNRRKNR